MGKGLGKVIGYAFVILIIIYLLYTPPVRHAFSDVKNLLSSGKDKVENFVSDNKETRQLNKVEKARQIPFPNTCSEIRKIYETYKDTYGTGNLIIHGQPKVTGMNAYQQGSVRRGGHFIGCNFTADNESKGQYGVFEIVVEKNPNIPWRYDIHENIIKIINTYTPKKK